jgi:plasmid stabilization system protein ParE
MTYSVQFFTPANQDVGEIVTWYKVNAPGQAGRFLEQLRLATRRLAEAPLVPREEPGALRKMGLRIFPYFVWYVVEGKVVTVLVVIHAHRDPSAVERRVSDYQQSLKDVS